MGAPIKAPNSAGAPNFLLWMIFGFGQIVLCGNLLFGLPAGILALMAKNAWDAGDAAGAKGKLKISKILASVGLVFFGILVLAGIAVPAFLAYIQRAQAVPGY